MKIISNKNLRGLALIDIITGFILVISLLSLIILNEDEIGERAMQFLCLLSLCIFISGSTAYFILSNIAYKLRKIRKTVKSFLQLLNDDERKIVLFLLKNGESSQNEIANSTHINKMKVSRRVKSLQQKGILQSEPVGLKNKVNLNKNIKELFELV
ncbi:MAG: Winged helix-turn-helix DNA-binding [Candidatus Woesearchaeota archaeon]|nr:Winged helix-turn-helix DNA-binding [Candidatus Woesearchaeota archaeon]